MVKREVERETSDQNEVEVNFTPGTSLTNVDAAEPTREEHVDDKPRRAVSASGKKYTLVVTGTPEEYELWQKNESQFAPDDASVRRIATKEDLEQYDESKQDITLAFYGNFSRDLDFFERVKLAFPKAFRRYYRG